MSPEPTRESDAVLSPRRWQVVRAAVEGTLALEPIARPAFLDEACGGDPDLRASAERLVLACERAAQSTGFLAGSAAAFASPMLVALERDLPPEAPSSGTPDGANHDLRPGDADLGALRIALADRYDLEHEIGRGGMATVFLAQDRKHRRPVALKLLNRQLGAVLGVDRFLAEIQVMARLQHPNLLPLFDSGEVHPGPPPHADGPGFLFYVMPYVDGESLRARLRRERQLPIGEAIAITVAVAGALDHAHRNGVVHRDLKPENILLHDGHPLVADFGIALAVSKAGGSRLTQTGVRIGTPQYMSPEQIAGEGVIDGRSDIFALACVLYEMLTGDPPHTGSSVQAVIARILSEPPRGVRTVRPNVPEAVEQALDRALAKLPADRFATAREFAAALSAAVPPDFETPRRGIPAPAARPSLRARLHDPVLLALGATAVLGGASAAWMWVRARQAPPPVTARFVVPGLTPGAAGPPAITPDGRSLVFPGQVDGKRMLLLRPIEGLEARPIAGTEGATSAVISPDGRSVAFTSSPTLATGRLSRVPLEGGTPTVLTTTHGNPAWGRGGAIALSHGEQGGLSWLSAAGEGPLHPLTRPAESTGETSHMAPLFTPDGKTVVFTVQKGGRMAEVQGELAIVQLDVGGTGPAPHVSLGVQGRYPIGVVDDWLLYRGLDRSTLMAVRLDQGRRRVVGAPVTALQDAGGIGGGVALAANGTLIYSRVSGNQSTPLLVDGRGARQVIPGTLGPFTFLSFPRISPDGRRMAIQSTSPQGTDVWIFDLAGGPPARLTTSSNATSPVWTPDGRRIVFVATGSGGAQELWWRPADGSAPAEKLLRGEDRLLPAFVTGDNRTLVYQARVGDIISIWSMRLDGDPTPRPVVRESFHNRTPALSPDVRWLAYVSDASGREEIYVRPFPADGAPVAISNGGGTEPVWSRNGERLYYRTGNQTGRSLVAATVSRTSRTFAVTSVVTLFADDFFLGRPQRNYDVTLDLNRFVMVGDTAARKAPDQIVVLNWFTEPRARLRANSVDP
jgi:serine/threonine-protein kinase